MINKNRDEKWKNVDIVHKRIIALFHYKSKPRFRWLLTSSKLKSLANIIAIPCRLGEHAITAHVIRFSPSSRNVLNCMGDCRRVDVDHRYSWNTPVYWSTLRGFTPEYVKFSFINTAAGRKHQSVWTRELNGRN